MSQRTRRARALVHGAIAASIGLAAIACGGAASSAPATPGPSLTTQEATPSPNTVATPIPVPSPSRPALTGEPHVVALVTALRSEPLITHLEQAAKAKQADGPTVEVGISADISGDDMALHLTTTFSGKTSKQDVVVVGDWAYIRADGGPWKQTPKAVAQASLDSAIQAIRLTDDPADLKYVGVETVDGRQLHHATASRTIPYVPANGGTGQYDKFDVWFEEDGTPVLAKTAFSATANSIKVSGTTEFRYSKFGGPIVIAAPSVAPSIAP
jgi:hypothetical protein